MSVSDKSNDMSDLMPEIVSMSIECMSDDSRRAVIEQSSEVLEGEALKALAYSAVALELSFANIEKIREFVKARLNKDGE